MAPPRKKTIRKRRPVIRRRRIAKKTYKPKGTTSKRTGLFKIQTLQPKEIFISIPYNQTFYYTNMGARQGFVVPLHFSVNMNNPIAQNIILQNASGTGASYDPVYTQENTNLNLHTVLQPYWSKHARAIVTSSSCKIQWTQELNQYKLDQWYNNIIPVGVHGGTTSNNYSSNHDGRLQIMDPVLDGDVYVSQVKSTTATSSSQSPYVTATTLLKLKTEVPGMQMRNLKCRKDTSKGCLLKSTYTPQRAFEIRDLKDNLDKFNFSVDASGNPSMPGKQAYQNSACHTRVPISFSAGGTPTGKQAPLFKVQVRVMYNIMLYRRKNIIGSNEEIPHTQQTPHFGDL